MKGIPLENRVGQKFGYLTVTDYGYKEYEGGLKKARGTLTFECVCGNVKTVLAHNLIQGETKSCGCKSVEMKTKHATKHGKWKERIYQTYVDMKQRCLNSNNKRYHRYGGRGIKICDEWLSDFMNFYNWAMDNGYEEHLTIERINNDGNYEPSNCKWATMEEQLKNRDFSRMGNRK